MFCALHLEPWLAGERLTLRLVDRAPVLVKSLPALRNAGPEREPLAMRPAERRPFGRKALLVVAALLVLLAMGGSGASALPTGFQETVVFTGLTNPAAIEFAADGRVFVAEKGGRIKVFAGLSDSAPDVFADLSANVHDFWDRGMLGFALDPAFTTGRPYVYVLYTYDAPIGGSPPRVGRRLSVPPGATGDGCVVSGAPLPPDGQRATS